MIIQEVRVPTTEILASLRRLVPQLTSNNPPPEGADLTDMLQSDASTLVVARVPDAAGEIVGSACLGLYRVPTGLRAVIEDVVVDSRYRGKGIGEALLRSLMELAQEAGARGVSLTSNSGREAANRLYRRLGFSLRETNSYYLEF